MRTARKMRAPRTEPAIAPVDDECGVEGRLEGTVDDDALGALETLGALGAAVEVGAAEDEAVVEDGEPAVTQDVSPDTPTEKSSDPPWFPLASNMKKMMSVPL